MHVDITQSPFYADKTGATDSTSKIRKAIQFAKNKGLIVFFPAGIYTVSDTLVYTDSEKTARGAENNSGIRLHGEGAERTLIRLKDGAFGEETKAVVSTINRGYSNVGYTNEVRGMTIDVGRENPRAIGLEFNGSNCAAVRNIRIVAGERSGYIGYKLSAGPSLTKGIAIEGFDFGILGRLYGSQSAVLEDVDIRGQRLAGVVLQQHPFSILGLNSENRVPAVVVEKGASLVLLNAALTGGAPSATAIQVEDKPNQRSYLFGRSLITAGYGASIREGDKVVSRIDVTEHVTDGVYFASKTGPLRSLNLPIKDAPLDAQVASSEWVGVHEFGAIGDGVHDDTTAFQKAVDSGKSYIYAKSGKTYRLTRPIILGGGVKRLDFFWSFLRPSGDFDTGDIQPLFRLIDGLEPIVVLQRATVRGEDGRKRFYFLEHATRRTVVLRDLLLQRGGVYTNSVPGGDVFLENVMGKTRGIKPPMPSFMFRSVNVWARQLNPDGGRHVINEGGRLWVLGFKTEDLTTAFSTLGGGYSEILGGHIHSNDRYPPEPVLVNEESHVSAILRVNRAKGHDIKSWVQEVRNGVTHQLLSNSTPTMSGGRMLPLYNGYEASLPDGNR